MIDVQLPATPAQQRLWLVDQHGPRGIEFSFPYLFELSGACDPERLESAVRAAVARHTPLRTTFELVDDVLHQVVHRTDSVDFFTVVDSAPGELAEIVADEVAVPFDLATDWPIRVRLYRLDAERSQFLINVHHIATDGLSMQILLDEIGAGYAGRELRPLPMSYVEVPPAPLATAAAVDYWREALTDPPQPVRLPGRRTASTRRSFAGRWYDALIPAGEVDELEKLSRAAGGSVFSALFGLLAVTLARRTGQTEVVVGVPFATRRPVEEPLIGFLVNLLPVRFGYQESMTHRELLADAAGVVAAALDHSNVPLDRIVAQSDAPAGAINALLSITLTEEDTPRLELPGCAVTNLDLRLDVARYHVAVDYRRLDSGEIRLEVSYGKDELDRADVVALIDDLRALVSTALAEPDQPLAAYPATIGAASVLVDDQQASAAESFETLWLDQLRHRADEPAVVDLAGALTVRELDGLARVMAVRLRETGVRPGQRVALATRRSRDIVIALLGTLMAGATPILLDAAHPPARLNTLMERAGAVAVVRSPGITGLTDELPALDVVTEAGSDDRRDAWQRVRDDLAYVIYTSGSTGAPKCVGVADHNALSLLAGLSALGIAEPGQVIGFNASFGFDASVQQWIRLFAGCTLVILDEDTRLDPEKFSSAVESHRLDEVDISPRHLDAILDVLLARLEAGAGTPLRVLVGGEAINPGLWKRLRTGPAARHLDCWNMYGPTECTVDSTVYPLALSADPTIGVPLPGIRLYVLDQWLRPVPPGTAGWLYLAGAGVSRGYLGAPGLTARVFLADPLQGDGSRMYVTGDRARLRQDGCVEFLGRVDDQVKISGYRVELGEIEQAARSHPGVTACAAVVDAAVADPVLRLYVVADQATAEALPGFLSSRLPSFMVPRAIVRLPAVPLTVQGKIDRAVLGSLTPTEVMSSGPVAESRAARVITEAWQEVLGRGEIDDEDDFFSLGGHSLLAIRVVARVRRELDVVLPIASVFEFPVLKDLARHVEHLVSKR